LSGLVKAESPVRLDAKLNELDQERDAKLEAKFESKLAAIRNDLTAVREAVEIILTRLTWRATLYARTRVEVDRAAVLPSLCANPCAGGRPLVLDRTRRQVEASERRRVWP
jgi:hypothetical protein